MNCRIETVQVTLKAGSTIGTKTHTLPVGHLLGANALVQSDSKLFLNCNIKNDSGTSINKSSDIRIWGVRNTKFEESYLPIGENTNGLTYIFEVSTAKNNDVKEDIEVQFILYYKKENSKC